MSVNLNLKEMKLRYKVLQDVYKTVCEKENCLQHAVEDLKRSLAESQQARDELRNELTRMRTLFEQSQSELLRLKEEAAIEHSQCLSGVRHSVLTDRFLTIMEGLSKTLEHVSA